MSVPASGPVAALDCGTNSTRLLICASDGAALERRMRITRLGEGVDATRKLAPDAIERTLDVLREYRTLMDAHYVTRARLAATSAARDADNASEFLDAAQAVTGVRPELLPGDEEGRLSFLGATADLPARPDGGAVELVIDIGGGSTELVVGATNAPDQAVARSLDIGCVRLTERFLVDDPPTPAQLAAARRHVESELVQARAVLPPLPDRDGRAIGLAGTVTTLASLALGLTAYDRDRTHHATLRRDEVETWLARLASEDSRARLARPGMVAGREDVIVGGVVVLAGALAVFERSTCLVSEADILDGLAASLR